VVNQTIVIKLLSDLFAPVYEILLTGPLFLHTRHTQV
jgi:hypothetical protein